MRRAVTDGAVLLHHRDPVRVPDTGYALGYHDHGRAGKLRLYRLTKPVLRLEIQTAGGVVQYEDLQDARTLFSEDEREVDPDSPAYVDRKLHLRSIDLSEGADHNRITDHGPIIDQDGRAARMIMSMAADDHGHVFTYGSWHVNSFKEATLQYLLFEYPGGDLYRLVRRGEFFAVINTGL